MSSNMMTSMLSGFNNYSKIRMNGMASGMDTQGTIDAMSMASKNRVIKQWTQIESLKWTQDAFRSQIDVAKKFQNTFFNTLKPETNMGSANLFNSFKATSAGGVKVMPTSSTTLSKVEIREILSKASAAELKSNDNFTLTKDINFDVTDLAALKAEMAKGGDKLQVNIDGSIKTIKLEGNTADEILTSLSDGINRAYGSNKVQIDASGKLVATGKSQITIVGAEYVGSDGKNNYGDAIMKELGLNINGVSNKLDRFARLDEAAFATGLKGDVFEFSINGVDFKFKKSDTISNVMNTINNSTANVKMTYSTIDDKFSITASQTGTGNTLDIKETAGNFFESIMGYKELDGSSITTSTLNNNLIKGLNTVDNPRDAVEDLLEKGISMTINGVTKNIYLPKYTASGDKIDYNKDGTNPYMTVAANLNDQIRKEFGVKDVEFVYVSPTEMALASRNKDAVSIGGVVTGKNPDGTDIIDDTLIRALGFADPDNRTNIASGTKTIADALGITGDFKFNNGTRDITLNSSNTVDQLVRYLNEVGNNVTFDTVTGRLTANLPAGNKLEALDANAKDVFNKLFGTEILEQPTFDPAVDPTIKAGTNAILNINGSEIERNSNVFTINGVDIDINDAKVFSDSATPPAGVPTGEKITIDITRNTEATFDSIVKFVDEYNKMITGFNLATTKRPARDYGPLTDEQKQGMSDSEIEKWEAKAKEGLLYNDKDIRAFGSQLRSALYSKPEGAPFALYDIGITTGEYKDGGMLIIDEAKLKKALSENPDGVSVLFTDKTEGLAAKITKTMDNYVKDIGVDKGILVAKAGIKDSPTEDKNLMSEQITKYNAKLKVLQQRYANEQDRLWKTFTAMEQNIANLNSQGSSIQAMFGGMGQQ